MATNEAISRIALHGYILYLNILEPWHYVYGNDVR